MLTRLTLPRLISDGMVLQRDSNVRIWGQAPSRESITIDFLGESHTTFSDIDNNWEIHLGELPAGGPHTMVITTTNSGAITIEDILIGDVYLCSGQSNMEHSLGSLAPHFNDEIAAADNSFLRHFKIPVSYEFEQEATDYTGGEWKSLSPDTAAEFSAVAYYYGKSLYDRYHIPIGLINASQGGSPCEAWLSERALKDFPNLMDAMTPYKSNEYATNELDSVNQAISNWYDTLYQEDMGSLEGRTPWYDTELDTSDWSSVTLPAYLSDSISPDFRGIVWLRRDFEVPASMAGQPATLLLGSIIDADTAYINGTYVGDTGYLYPRRRYMIPEGLLTEGTNTITVRLISNSGTCGFVPGKDYQILSCEGCISIEGEWKYKVGLSLDYDRPSELFLAWKPSALFKGMLAPALRYAIRGIIWYQAESNSNTIEEVDEYSRLFSCLIKTWRKRFQLGDLPFLYVQLPNWGEQSETPQPDNSLAYMRDVQAQALALPHTGMAVTYDVGEWNDLHPLDKKSVGERLARLAYREIYGEHITASSPTLRKIEVANQEYVLSFHHVGQGLITADGKEPSHLYFEDKNGNFHKAHAKICDNQLHLSCPDCMEPVSIYYAWAASPIGANLCNQEGLPAAPFRKQL